MHLIAIRRLDLGLITMLKTHRHLFPKGTSGLEGAGLGAVSRYHWLPLGVRNSAWALKDPAPTHDNGHPSTGWKPCLSIPWRHVCALAADFLPQGHYAIKALSGFPFS